jgi:hypothetical protein
MLARLFRSLFRRRAADGGTSLSDNQSYPAVCARAATDPAFFASFRREPAYTCILEHVTQAQGRVCLDLIEQDAVVTAALDEFRRNDQIGNPCVFDYARAGRFSPSTLRYAKVLCDLRALFGPLDGMRICEIGVGYGGQCRIVSALHRPAGYCLIDIEPALDLARHFLGHFEIQTELSFKTMAALKQQDYDLVISNYAFTELKREIQDVYLDKVIRRAGRGYITYNEITAPEFRSYADTELLAMFPGSRRIEELPLTHPRNCIIAWGGNY